MNPMSDSTRLLKLALTADAIVSAAAGLLQVVGGEPLARLLALPPMLLFETGLFFLVYAAAVAFVASRRPIPRPAAWVIAIGNLGWAVASLLLLLSGAVAPSALGAAYVLAQALAVAVFGVAQYAGLGRARVQTA